MLKDNVALHMRKKGWMQKELAAATGLSETAISYIVRGKRTKPDYDTLVKLSKALDVSIDDLVAGSNHLLSS